MTAQTELARPGDLARFGVFELDLGSGELRRGGVKVKLQDQPLRLLAFLLENAGRVVTREELQARLWPEEFVDFDHSLNTAIRKLRAALDDSADNPRFVETLARRGYRFIAPVTWVSTETTPAPEAEPEPVVAAPARRSRMSILLAVAGILAISLGIIVGRLLVRGRTVSPESIESIAVLPFTIDDRRNEHVSDGLTEILIDKLSRLPNLRVMARSTVFRWKGKTFAPRDAGKELGVHALVMGVIRREGDRHAIHVELIDARDGAQIWGHRYSATAADLPLVQSRITEDLSAELRSGLTAAQRSDSARAHTTNAEAYELYLRGLHLWNDRGEQNLRKSIGYFEQAARLDPQFAAAHAGIASAYGVLVGYGRIPASEGAPKVIAAAQRALALDPTSAEAYTSLATTKFRNEWDFAGAEKDYRQALALNPNYATGHQWYADLLRATGRPAEARKEVETALRLDPLSGAIRGSMCWHLYLERRYREAIAFSDAGLRLGPGFGSPHLAVRSYLMLGDIEGALEEMRTSPFELHRLAHRFLSEAYRRGGREEFLRRFVAGLESVPDAATSGPVEIAEIHALLGDKDRALHWLEIAAEHRVSRVTDLNVIPAFDILRDDPRYVRLVQRIGLPL